jgi:hypothetical protein
MAILAMAIFFNITKALWANRVLNLKRSVIFLNDFFGFCIRQNFRNFLYLPENEDFYCSYYFSVIKQHPGC